jgi:Cytochrome C and Quinol oxidase polypeptide I
MGAVFALFAGFYYWTPKIVGRNINDFLGKIHFWTLFVGVNLTFFPQHFLGMAGIILLLFINVALPCASCPGRGGEAANSLIFCIHTLSLLPIKPFGPHILPEFLNKPVRIYKPNFDRNLIGIENRNRTIIYQ